MSLFLLILGLIIIAFFCEYAGATLGMGYGTTLAPVLIILGYEPIVIVPAILLSQLLAGFAATIFNHRLKNMNITSEPHERMALGILTLTGVLGVVAAIFINISLDQQLIKVYIACVVILMGLLMLKQRKSENNYSSINLGLVGVISAFNKGISGAGHAPIVVNGQILSGISPKAAVAITALVQGFICAVGIIIYVLLTGISDPILTLSVTVGALIATPFSAYTTSRIDQQRFRLIIAGATLFIGFITLLAVLFVPFV